MITLSDYLLSYIREMKDRIKPDLSRRELVTGSLEFLYHACMASEQLLFDAAIAASVHDDPFSKHLESYYRTHLEEEKGELEILVGDLANAGIDASVSAPGVAVMAMIGTQYYLAKHVHPASLLGYMAIQEADPTPIQMVEHLEEAYGKDLFRFLRLHAIKDLEHRKELISVIDRVPENLKPLVVESATNALSYITIFYGRR